MRTPIEKLIATNFFILDSTWCIIFKLRRLWEANWNSWYNSFFLQIPLLEIVLVDYVLRRSRDTDSKSSLVIPVKYLHIWLNFMFKLTCMQSNFSEILYSHPAFLISITFITFLTQRLGITLFIVTIFDTYRLTSVFPRFIGHTSPVKVYYSIHFCRRIE